MRSVYVCVNGWFEAALRSAPARRPVGVHGGRLLPYCCCRL